MNADDTIPLDRPRAAAAAPVDNTRYPEALFSKPGFALARLCAILTTVAILSITLAVVVSTWHEDTATQQLYRQCLTTHSPADCKVALNP